MFDFKCSMQAQLDNLWLKPEDLARGIDVRVSSVRKWLDPELDCVPVKDAFDWVYDQTEKLGNLTVPTYPSLVSRRGSARDRTDGPLQSSESSRCRPT